MVCVLILIWNESTTKRHIILIEILYKNYIALELGNRNQQRDGSIVNTEESRERSKLFSFHQNTNLLTTTVYKEWLYNI